MLYYIIILMAFLGSGYVQGNKTYCDGRWIDNTKICCGGKVHERTQNSVEMDCCNLPGKSEVYPVHEKICCGDQLTPKVPGVHLECCNKERIDRSQYDCCGDESFGVKYNSGKCCVDWDKKTVGVHASFNTRSKCCGTIIYSKDTHRCKVGPKGEKSIEIKTTMKTCGTKKYDPEHSLCCHQTNNVIPKPHEESGSYQPNWKCWNDEPYDSNKYYVDDKTSEVILQGLATCGKEKYSRNSRSLKCCDDTLIPVIPGKNLTCCGNKLLDLDDTSKTCCNGTFIPTATKACCNEVAYDTGHDIKCCANILYNKTTDMCCETQTSYYTVIQKQKSHHTNCCKSAEKMETYDKYSEVCVNGQVRGKYQQIFNKTRVSPTNAEPSGQGRNEMEPCPFCKSSHNSKICNKKHVFKFFVYEERETKSGTILNGVILEPYLRHGEILNGEKVKIRTRNQCECFKPRRTYYLFTNRKIKSFKENRYSIRFTSDDVFIRKPEASLTVKCVTNHLSGTFWNL